MLHRQKSLHFLNVLLLTIAVVLYVPSIAVNCSGNQDCRNGFCNSGRCECRQGFWGTDCKFSRLRLTDAQGVITDGEGKYPESAKCSWLVEPQRANTTISITIEEFATECTWDHLYIYDGKSIDSPLIAAFSGLIRDKSNGTVADEPVRTVEAKSGSAFLYFYSDAHYTLNGFNISYRTIQDCTAKCSGHGRCNSSGHCLCESSWTGPKCDQPTCPETCEQGVCDPLARQCRCYLGYTGAGCSVEDGRSYWSSITANNQDEIAKRASHGAVVIGNWMWVVGGYSLNKYDMKNDFIARYNMLTNTWEVIRRALSSPRPAHRYGHSVVAYGESIIIYGGDVGTRVVRDLWCFDIKSRQWSQVLLSVDSQTPLAVVGHTATVLHSKMVVLFGYSEEEHFSNTVQEFDLGTKRWSRFTSPHCIRGSYGHSSVYNPNTGLIYVHGGYKQSSVHTSVELSNDLIAYDPHKRLWFTLRSSGYPRFLHSAVFMGNLMFVFGGNTHNDTAHQTTNAKCYSAAFLTYNMRLNVWMKMPDTGIPTNSGRYGHSAVAVNSTMYVFGGFSGVMFNDILTYTAGNCSKWGNMSSCLSANYTSVCVWEQATGNCIDPLPTNTTINKTPLQCSNKTTCLKGNICKLSMCNYSECDACLKVRACMWCESQQRCHRIPAYVVTFPYGQCRAWTDHELGCFSTKCAYMNTCSDCHTLPGCGWCDDGSGTGLGRCMEGGDDGARSRSFNSSDVQCPKERWNFVGCPPCRCNGHSLCTNVFVCENCQHQTRGPHCEYCDKGYYGDARNGGRCERCQCNGHGVTCDHSTGQCDCMEVGVIGHKCDKCSGYYIAKRPSYLTIQGNATSGGRCYIEVFPCDGCAATPFNVTGKSVICLQTTPYESRDLMFSIKVLSGGIAYLNFSVVSDVMSERVLESELKIGSYKRTVSHTSYPFKGSERVTFRVCVYNIQRSLSFTILFNQPKPLLDLLIFFATFFGCFFSLLLIAAIVWKIKLRWFLHLSARRRLEEQARRASRPFAKLHVELPNVEDCPLKSTADTIAWELCSDKKAAVATVLMRLPAVENGCAPIGGCGITCASALVTCKHPGMKGLTVSTKRKSRVPKETQTCL